MDSIETLVVQEAHGLEVADVFVVVIYFAIVIGVGCWASLKATTHNAQGYFLAGRSSNWLLIGTSTFATNVGAPMFIGLAGSAAANGYAVAMFEWHAMFVLLLLGWLFLPVYRSSGCFTMPQYLRLRYGGQRIRLLYAFIQVFLTIMNQVGGQIYAAALFITVIFKWNLYGSIIFILVITALYTLIGGLTAVLWTDAIQTAIMVISCTVLATVSLYKVGGYESMKERYVESVANYTRIDVELYGNHTCGLPPDDAFNVFRPAGDGAFPWPGMIFGLTILAVNFWCTDQICVQRALSAKNVSHAKAGVVLAAYLKILPFFFFIIPGMIGRILFPEEVACADPDQCERICKNPRGCTNIAFAVLVNEILPTGIKGIMLAALLAALMSSLTSIFNSCSTLFTMDIWRYFRPKAKESELMVVGRLWTLFLMLVGVGWLPILLRVQGSDFWAFSQSIFSFLVPPLSVIFTLGIFWNRTTEQGAFAGLIVGLLCGFVRVGLEWPNPPPPCGSNKPNRQFAIVKYVHYLHFAVISAVVSTIVVVVISLITKPRDPNKLRRTTWWTKDDPELPEESEESDVEQDLPVFHKDATGVKYLLCKWGCGVDQTIRRTRLSREERILIQQRFTSIKEDPYWKKVMDINMILCGAVALVLHSYWA